MSIAGEASEGAFKVNSLGNLEHADAGAGKLQWDRPRSLWNMSFIIGALVLGPLLFQLEWRAGLPRVVGGYAVRWSFGRLPSPPDPPQLRMSKVA